MLRRASGRAIENRCGNAPGLPFRRVFAPLHRPARFRSRERRRPSAPSSLRARILAAVDVVLLVDQARVLAIAPPHARLQPRAAAPRATATRPRRIVAWSVLDSSHRPRARVAPPVRARAVTQRTRAMRRAMPGRDATYAPASRRARQRTRTRSRGMQSASQRARHAGHPQAAVARSKGGSARGGSGTTRNRNGTVTMVSAACRGARPPGRTSRGRALDLPAARACPREALARARPARRRYSRGGNLSWIVLPDQTRLESNLPRPG